MRSGQEPIDFDQRFMQSKTRHQIFKALRSYMQSLTLSDYLSQSEVDWLVRTCAVRMAQDSNSLKIQKKSQSIGLPSITLDYRNCRCQMSLLTLLVYLRLSSILIPFYITLVFSLVLLSTLMTVPASFPLSLLSIQQNKIQVSI